MFPVLLEVPFLGIKIYSYGLLYASAYIVAFSAAAWMGRRWQGLAPEAVYGMGIVSFLCGLAGAWLLQASVEALAYGRGPASLLNTLPVRGGAGAFYGGVIAAMLGMAAYTGWRRLYWWHNVDVVFAALPLGLALGRLGCFAAGCCWGKACDLPWAVTFPEAAGRATGVPAGLPLHPVQAYAVAGNLVLFALLVQVLRKKTFAGQVVLAWAVAYAALRFLLEIFRDDPRGITPLWGLSTSQVLAVLFALAALAALPCLRRRGLPDGPSLPADDTPASPPSG